MDQRCGSLLNPPWRRGPVLMRVSYDSAQLFVPRGAPFECLDALPIIVTSFGRLTFRRSLPLPAMHGSNRCAFRTGETNRRNANTIHFDCSCCPRHGATRIASKFENLHAIRQRLPWCGRWSQVPSSCTRDGSGARHPGSPMPARA